MKDGNSPDAWWDRWIYKPTLKSLASGLPTKQDDKYLFLGREDIRKLLMICPLKSNTEYVLMAFLYWIRIFKSDFLSHWDVDLNSFNDSLNNWEWRSVWAGRHDSQGLLLPSLKQPASDPSNPNFQGGRNWKFLPGGGSCERKSPWIEKQSKEKR